MAKRPKKKQESSFSENLQQRITNLSLGDERVRIAFGLVILVIWVFFALSMLSFLFTGAADQSKLDMPFWDLLKNSDVKFENWTGKIGAYLSNTFVNNSFGLGAFCLLYYLFVAGMKLMKQNEANLRKVLFHSLLGMLWLSLFFGFFFVKGYEDSFLFLGGTHGYFMGEWISAAIGNVGAVFLILLIPLLFFIFTVDNSIDILRSIPARLKKTATENSDTHFGNIYDPDLGYSAKDKVEDDEVEEEEEDDDFFYEPKLKPTEVQKPDLEYEQEIAVEPRKPVKIDGMDVQKAPSEELHLEVEQSEEEELVRKNRGTDQMGDYDPTLDLSNYKHPRLDLLVDYKSDVVVDENELVDNKNRIVKTLENYSITIDSIKATIGPTVTLYEIVPAAGVRIAKIKNLEDDIALSLSALGIRIIAPIPGKGTIGIEVPNLHPEMVSMYSVIASKKFQESTFELPVALGKTITNETYIFDLAKMPHLLVAGATGQGKSVGLNAIIASLLYKKHPSQLKFVMVDPKKVELSIYAKIDKHFMAVLPDQEDPIINDVTRVVQTLNSLTIEMDNRYDLLKKAHTRNLKEYNAKFIKRQLNPENGHKFLPYIVIIIDEFADLIMTAGKEVELPIARIAQLARAVGIHMVIATQRPSTNIITGVIKANFPARIAFKVSQMIDSRTILDSPGANQLIGRGDMLISFNSMMVRLQCAFIDTPEVEAIVEHIHSQQGYPVAFELPEFVPEGSASSGSKEDDPLSNIDSNFVEAARIIVANQSGSTSLLQRRFSIGYNRAGRMMDQMEAAGIVGPFEGSKARKVLIPDEYSLEKHIQDMGL